MRTKLKLNQTSPSNPSRRNLLILLGNSILASHFISCRKVISGNQHVVTNDPLGSDLESADTFKSADFIHPTDYGASLDNYSGNPTAFKKAAEAARTQGKPILVGQRFNFSKLLDWDLTDVKLYGTKDGLIVTTGISIKGARFKIKNLTFITKKTQGSMINIYGNDGIVENCRFEKLGGISDSQDADRSSPLLAIGLKGDLSGKAAGTHLHSRHAPSKNITVKDCRFFYAGTGLIIGNSHHTIVGCQFSKLAAGINVTATGRDIEIRDCKMYSMIGASISGNAGITVFQSARRIKIIGNNIKSAAEHGMYIQASHVTVANNTVSECKHSGIKIASKKNLNFFYADEKINLDPYKYKGNLVQKNILIYENTVINCPAVATASNHSAIYLQDSLRDVNIRGNTIESSFGHGIRMATADYGNVSVWENISMTRNNFKGSFERTLAFFEPNQNGIEISENSFSASSKAFYLKSITNLKFTGNSFSGSTIPGDYSVRIALSPNPIIAGNSKAGRFEVNGNLISAE